MGAKTYDIKSISIIIGTRAMTGFADGDVMKVERNEDSWSLLVGASGEATRAKTNNRSGKFTLRLLASSADNDYLSELQVADELTGNSTFPVLVKDSRGASIYSAVTAWFVKAPEASFAAEAGTREWVIETDELIAFAGGQAA